MTRGRYRWALAVVAVSAFMITMDNTVVVTALPTIARDLDMSKSALDWVATGYILMFSCLMIAGGRLTDIYGCRVIFMTGMAIFTVSSAVCGLADDAAVLITGRIVQGAGAALALPATQVVITVGRTDKQRSVGTIAWVSAAGGATALGPAIGGFIAQHWHWGWIFLINIIPGILVIMLGSVVLTSKGENKHARIDLPGVMISATMLFALIYGLETGRHHGWTDPAVLGVFALAGIALLCFIVVERWAPDPMVNLAFFRNRVFVGGLLSQMLWGIGFNGMIFYAATFLQRFLGFSPPKSGLVMLPSAIVVMAMTPVAFWIAMKLGPRLAIGGGMTMMAAGMVLFSTIQRDDDFADLMPGVLIVGLGSAMCMPLVMYVLKSVPEDKAGVASGILNVIREASGAFGIAILGLLIHDIPKVGAPAPELEEFRHGTASGLILGAALVLVGGVIAGLTLPSRRGWMGPKHTKRRVPIPIPGAAGAAIEPVPTLQPVPAARPEPDSAIAGGHRPGTGPDTPRPSAEPAAPHPGIEPAAPHPGIGPTAPRPSAAPAAPHPGIEPAAPHPGIEPAAPRPIPDPAAPRPGAEPAPVAARRPAPEPWPEPDADDPLAAERAAAEHQSAVRRRVLAAPHYEPAASPRATPLDGIPTGAPHRAHWWENGERRWPPPPPEGFYDPYVPEDAPRSSRSRDDDRPDVWWNTEETP
ncbi:MDR family MFS transporter [Actinomadura flavalba]|uniref:MDR family MFS transporter n=1 Tax=Actinomadura flavalba TaxID=1120938 RepID=UPI000366CF81|nr:MFS transporter [Actinomadura flavalba]